MQSYQITLQSLSPLPSQEDTISTMAVAFNNDLNASRGFLNEEDLLLARLSRLMNKCATCGTGFSRSSAVLIKTEQSLFDYSQVLPEHPELAFCGQRCKNAFIIKSKRPICWCCNKVQITSVDNCFDTCGGSFACSLKCYQDNSANVLDLQPFRLVVELLTTSPPTKKQKRLNNIKLK
jgi:hypothetical protein